MIRKIALSSLLLSAQLPAHPHSWIDMQTELIADGHHISHIVMRWTMDPMTTADTLVGLDPSSPTWQADLRQLADDTMANMAESHYLSHLTIDGHHYDLLAQKGSSYQLKGDKLVFEFRLTLAQSVPLLEHTLRFQVYDPTFYLDTKWMDRNDIRLSPQLAQQCQMQLFQPNPSAEQISYAAAIPVDVTPEEDLGSIFAQTLELQCR